MIRGICTVRGKVKVQFVETSSGGDLVSSLNAFTKNIQLPSSRYPVDMYLPGMNFAGPGIRLDLRLDEDRSPKDFSKPVNRVDGAAYRHDLACVTFPNTKRRNVADGK